MYQIVTYHSGDNKQNQGERLLEEVISYGEAVKAIKRVASSWYGLASGVVVARRNRIEFRGNGWGTAVYIVYAHSGEKI